MLRRAKTQNFYTAPEVRFLLLILAILIILIPAIVSKYKDELGFISGAGTIEVKYDVRVHHHYDPITYFPGNWLEDPISATGSQLPYEEVERVLPLIDQFLSAYPSRIIDKDLKSIYLVSELTIYGKEFGGTNSWAGIYIKSQGVEKGYSDVFLRGLMHSEFSSILMRNYTFPELKWSRVNRVGFQYSGDGTEALGRRGLYSNDSQLLQDGFLVQYSKSSMENDFNMMSGWLFTRRDELKNLASRYPKIDAKMKLAINFYKSIDNQFMFD